MNFWFGLLTSLGLMTFVGCHRGPSSPLAQAAVRADVETVRRLAAGTNKEDLQDALIASARTGSVASIPVLIAAGADPNGRWGVNSWSPLQHAIHKGQREAVLALLSAGADVNLRDRHQRTALMMATGYGMTNMVTSLLEHGADAMPADEDGLTALDFAISGVSDIDDFTIGQCRPDVVKALLDAAPALALSEKSWQAVATVVSRCSEVQQMVRQKRAALQGKAAGPS